MDNLVLLCPDCHAESPDAGDPAIFWQWWNSFREPLSEWYLLRGLARLDELSALASAQGFSTGEVAEITEIALSKASLEFGVHYRAEMRSTKFARYDRQFDLIEEALCAGPRELVSDRLKGA